MNKELYQKMLSDKAKGKKSFAVLLDPDVEDANHCRKLVRIAEESKVDYFFVGGSLITQDNLGMIVRIVRENSTIPIVIFPGNNFPIDANADAMLFLSLISGRNADLLIGQHVIAAPILKRSNLEILSTGYMLVDGGKQTSVSYITNTTPLPADKPAIAACTAMAGEMLGLKLIFMDAGSGAQNPISPKMIGAVSRSVQIPLIIGGGINTKEKAIDALNAGADIIVIGNGIEKNMNLLIEVADKIHELNTKLKVSL